MQSLNEFLRKYAVNSHSEKEHEAFVIWLKTIPAELLQEVLEKYLHLSEVQARGEFETYPYLIDKIENRLDEIDNQSNRLRAITTPFFTSTNIICSPLQ